MVNLINFWCPKDPLNIVLDAKISGSRNHNFEKKIVEMAGFFSIILKKVELMISYAPNVCQ